MPRRINIGDLSSLSPKEINFCIEYCIDFSARNAAERSGYSADYGYQLQAKETIQAAIEKILSHRLESSHIDAEYVLMCAAEHRELAIQQGNLAAANSALNIMAKHTFVNAYAPDRVELTTSKDILDRLQRGKHRVKELRGEEVSFF